MKLEQGQVWKTSATVHSHNDRGLYLRIVQLERLSVGYKEMSDLRSQDGKHKTATKKEFCRMIKGAELIQANA